MNLAVYESRSSQAKLVRQYDCVRTISRTELGKDVVDMCLDRRLAYVQFRCDLAIRASLHDHAQDVAFALSQPQLLCRRLELLR